LNYGLELGLRGGCIMDQILASYSVSISELKKNPSALLNASEGAPIAILNHNKPTAYLVPVETYEAMLEQLEDVHLAKVVKQRLSEKAKLLTVTLDDL
jgi:antitoxin StbD